MVLIPFQQLASAGENENRLLASERAEVDAKLQQAINKANMAAGMMIQLGVRLANTVHEAQVLMDRVAEAIGTLAMQRVYVSYGWLIHATYLVMT